MAAFLAPVPCGVGVTFSGRSRRSNTCRQPCAAWCSQKLGLISGPRGSDRLAGSLIPNESADLPWSPGSAGALLARDPAAMPWPRGSATPSRLRFQRGEAATARRGHRLPRPVRLPHYRPAGGMLLRAKAVAFCSPHHGDTSTTVGGTRSCRAAWSARHPVKVEVAGSNPVRTAGIPGEVHWGPSQVR